MPQKPKPGQKHSAKERWNLIERGISFAIPRPKFAAFYLVQLLRKLAGGDGYDSSTEDVVDTDCRSKVIELEGQVEALTAVVNELTAAVEDHHPADDETADTNDAGGGDGDEGGDSDASDDTKDTTDTSAGGGGEQPQS